MKLISIIVPCYNEEEVLPVFYEEISKIITKMKKKSDFEIILVNDGSKDNTLNVIKKLHQKNKKIRYISFSKNFGKEAAMYAGLEASTGNYIAVMDADLQDPPELLEEMFDTLEQKEYDCIATRRVTRDGEPKIRSFFARQFYKLINKLSNIEMVDGARDFRLMTRQMVNAILEMKEYNRYTKGLFSFVGFNTKWIEFKNIERACGKSKWSFFGLFVYAIDGIVSFSTKPLIVSALFGLLFCFISIILIIFIIVRTLIWDDPVSGWPSTICIIFFIGGIQLLCTGILGIYLSKTYMEVKNRPIYFVKETEQEEKKD